MKIIYTAILIFIGWSASSQNSAPLKESSNISESPNVQTFADRGPDFEQLSAPNYAGIRSSLKMPVERITNTSQTAPIIPYPIIFIHGLISSSETWNTFTNYLDTKYGFTYGGRLDYCLNFDRNDSTSNLLFGTVAGKTEDIGTFATTLISGDYYCVNFNVGYNGSFNPSGSAYDVKSNQSAIAKQGMAIKWAIYEVLQKTGRDKVVLVGHSMGGLAAREYLQNSALWQADGDHHVAKLVTTGTPHGGSNASSYGIAIGGLSEQSEAIRDLRNTYYYSKDKGVYLWGGTELQNDKHMNDNLYKEFYNVDVNSNGMTNEPVVGLNEKKLPVDLDYACIVGKCSGCLLSTEAGDGVVSAVYADLKNIYTSAAINQFYYTAYAATEIHTALPNLAIQNMQGLDEPNTFELAYHIDLQTNYTGFTTVQAAGSSAQDEDHYEFKISKAGELSVKINKTDLTDLTADIYDSGYNKVGATVHTKGLSTITFSQAVSAGDYYLVISNAPTTASYTYPYNFILNSTTTEIVEYSNPDIKIYPNPVSSSLSIYTENYKFGNAAVYILNSLGQEVLKVPYSASIDVSTLMKGIYFIKIKSDEKTEIMPFAKD